MLSLLCFALLGACDAPQKEEGFVPHCDAVDSALSETTPSPSGLTPEAAVAALGTRQVSGEGWVADLQPLATGARWVTETAAVPPPGAVVASLPISCTDHLALQAILTVTSAQEGTVVGRWPVSLVTTDGRQATVAGALPVAAASRLWGAVETAPYTDVALPISGHLSADGGLEIHFSLEGTVVGEGVVGRAQLRSLTLP